MLESYRKAEPASLFRIPNSRLCVLTLPVIEVGRAGSGV